MANDRLIDCKIKERPGKKLSSYEKKELSKEFRNLFYAYDLQVVVLYRNRD